MSGGRALNHDAVWRITRDGRQVWLKLWEMTDREREHALGQPRHMLWAETADDERLMLAVPESELMREERVALRCADVAMEFRLKPVLDDIEDAEKHLVYLRGELDRRRKKLSQVGEDMQRLTAIIGKVDRAMAGEVELSEVTKDEQRWLEGLHVRTMPYASLTDKEKDEARERLEQAAKDAFKNGFTFYRSTGDDLEGAEDGEADKIEFKTLDEAREFYGLVEATEGEED